MTFSIYTPDKAEDDDLQTRWSSRQSDNQWIYVDLGAVHNINRVVLNWEEGRQLQLCKQIDENIA